MSEAHGGGDPKPVKLNITDAAVTIALGYLQDSPFKDDPNFQQKFKILLKALNRSDIDEQTRISIFEKSFQKLSQEFQQKYEIFAQLTKDKKKKKIFIFETKGDSKDDDISPTGIDELLGFLKGVQCHQKFSSQRSPLTQTLLARGIKYLVHQFPCSNLKKILQDGFIAPGGGKANFNYEQISAPFQDATPRSFVFFNLANEFNLVNKPPDITGTGVSSCALYFPVEMIDWEQQHFHYVGDGWQYGTGRGANVTVDHPKNEVEDFFDTYMRQQEHIRFLHEVVFSGKFFLRDALFLQVSSDYEVSEKEWDKTLVSHGLVKMSVEEAITSTTKSSSSLKKPCSMVSDTFDRAISSGLRSTQVLEKDALVSDPQSSVQDH